MSSGGKRQAGSFGKSFTSKFNASRARPVGSSQVAVQLNVLTTHACYHACNSRTVIEQSCGRRTKIAHTHGVCMSITQNVCRWMTNTVVPALGFAVVSGVALATVPSAQSVAISAGVEKVAQTQITRDTLE